MLSATGAQGIAVSGLSGKSPANVNKDMAEFNGTYWLDEGAKQRDGWSRPFKNANNWTLEYSPGGHWCLNVGYASVPYYKCQSDAPTPPLTGWVVTAYGTAPPPSFSRTTRAAQARPRSP